MMKLLQLINIGVPLFGLVNIASGAQAQIAVNTNKSVVDLSGYSVSLSDDATTLAIGTHQANNSTKSGRVRIYKNNLGVWNQIGDNINGEAVGDRSGCSLSLSQDGNTVNLGTMLNGGNYTVIFSSDDGYIHLWDGTSPGSSLPPGSYLYLIQNGPDKYKGTATILL